MKLLRVLVACSALGSASLHACTIFVLTDAEDTLFCNNEDWFNATTRLWFVPAGKDHLGCAFVGFDDGWAQGGMNTGGLAFDWWASGKVDYIPDPALRRVRGNPAERMLESCTTVNEAIAFFQRHREPSFATARILIADSSGASVVIYAKDGRMQIEKSNDTRGIGYGRQSLNRELPASPRPTIDNSRRILQACFQPGDDGTKYSNVFNLKTGAITVFTSTAADPVTLDLASELKKGGHFYDIPKLAEQVGQPAQTLLPKMRRFYLDDFQPLAAADPAVTQRLHAIIVDAAKGKMKTADYAPELWEKLSPIQNEVGADLQKFGALRSLVQVERHAEGNGRSFRCLVDFEKARVLGRYDLDANNRVTLIHSEFVELKTE